MGSVINLISDYGVGLFVFIIVGYFLYLYGKHRLLPKMTGNTKPQSVIKLNDEANLIYHALFANINHRISNEIPTLDLLPDKPIKQQMFRDILMIYTKTLFNVCKDITALDLNSWTSDQWCNEMIQQLNLQHVTFVNTCKTNGIPDIVMVKFTKWHKLTQDILFDGIMSLGTSNIFSSNAARTNTLFYMINLLLVTTIADAEKTLKELNGDVHGKTYNGGVIEN